MGKLFQLFRTLSVEWRGRRRRRRRREKPENRPPSTRDLPSGRHVSMSMPTTATSTAAAARIRKETSEGSLKPAAQCVSPFLVYVSDQKTNLPTVKSYGLDDPPLPLSIYVSPPTPPPGTDLALFKKDSGVSLTEALPGDMKELPSTTQTAKEEIPDTVIVENPSTTASAEEQQQPVSTAPATELPDVGVVKLEGEAAPDPQVSISADTGAGVGSGGLASISTSASMNNVSMHFTPSESAPVDVTPSTASSEKEPAMSDTWRFPPAVARRASEESCSLGEGTAYISPRTSNVSGARPALETLVSDLDYQNNVAMHRAQSLVSQSLLDADLERLMHANASPPQPPFQFLPVNLSDEFSSGFLGNPRSRSFLTISELATPPRPGTPTYNKHTATAADLPACSIDQLFVDDTSSSSSNVDVGASVSTPFSFSTSEHSNSISANGLFTRHVEDGDSDVDIDDQNAIRQLSFRMPETLPGKVINRLASQHPAAVLPKIVYISGYTVKELVGVTYYSPDADQTGTVIYHQPTKRKWNYQGVKDREFWESSNMVVSSLWLGTREIRSSSARRPQTEIVYLKTIPKTDSRQLYHSFFLRSLRNGFTPMPELIEEWETEGMNVVTVRPHGTPVESRTAWQRLSRQKYHKVNWPLFAK